MSEEEILDKYIKEVNNLIIAYNYHKENGVETALGEKIDIFEGLLNLYNKEKEKNKLLKTYKGNLPENVELICLCKNDFERNISTDYISKAKIREKIKELENEIEIKSLYEENWNKIEVLKELLEENKSNENNI